ncbi:TWiK family of potassium channels protein 18 [Biomphalaria pfeifferi]|uniref:TWiK family of potassium channels protein 18 n=1 Tax=Biomphalaria pfeifferi TaxID=112525 RepID=A0AAD8BU16_BIOPF|nr:TWiK family of potassium channels protein 18 [Biomphalaria pfeifferi]
MSTKPEKDGCCRTVTKFLFSHIGLCLMVVLYCVAGGFIFEHLEKNNEEQICYESRSEYEPMQSKTINSTLNIFYQNGGIVNDKAREMMVLQLESVLETFRNNSLAIGYNGRWCQLYGQPNGPSYDWSWPGAVLFSVTVVTTIGYGHIAPKTVWGRLVCIAYAVLGIPLMLLCLANIGDALADIFRFIYAKICCCGACRKKKKDTDQVVPIQNSETVGHWNSDKKSMAGNPMSQVAPLDTKFTRMASKSPTDSMDMSDTRRLTSAGSRGGGKNTVQIVPLDLKKNDPVILDDDSDSDEDDELENRKVTVPLTITMIVIGGYIFGGAVLFGLWEGWDWLQSAYFCFITLSTIGFGDVVPGRDFDNPQVQAQLMLGSIYILFGMAILSMCFALMQEEILAKARWIGQKLGIIEKEAED